MVTRTEVQFAMEKFRHETGLRVTNHAQQLIWDIVSGIADDPHSRWSATSEELRKVSDSFVASLPGNLKRLAQEEHVQVVTTFDVLHWVANNLDRVCPIQKTER